MYMATFMRMILLLPQLFFSMNLWLNDSDAFYLRVLFDIVSDMRKVWNEARNIKVSNMQIGFNPN